MTDREHEVTLSDRQVTSLAQWLDHPDRVLHLGRMTLEADDEGGLLIRTQPPAHQPRPRHMPGLADIVVQALAAAARSGASRVDSLMVGDADDVAEAKVEALISGRLAEVAREISEAIRA